ncbi:MAG TPA: hypothetical protein PKC28_06225 [Bdellovibrionales bacterium]|nr:hypothetical protein [Bdellovibrionales bacterium]
MRVFGIRFTVLKLSALLAFALSAIVTHAGVPDLSAGVLFRSYPISTVGAVNAGYGQVLWGDNATPFYGYVRATGDFYTAATYNALVGGVEFFPLAFLGARAGGEANQNDNDYIAYQCELYECLGRRYRTYFESELTLGAGPFFVQGKWRRERWSRKDADGGDFIDPTSGFVLKSQGDSETVYTGAAGMKINAQWTALVSVRYAESDEYKGYSRMPAVLARYVTGVWTFAGGVGQYESSVKTKEVTAMGFVRWEFAPSVTLK